MNSSEFLELSNPTPIIRACLTYEPLCRYIVVQPANPSIREHYILKPRRSFSKRLPKNSVGAMSYEGKIKLAYVRFFIQTDELARRSSHGWNRYVPVACLASTYLISFHSVFTLKTM